MPLLVVTLVGPDRPGLVGAVADVVRTHNGNWLESRMSHLARHFAGIVLIDVAADRADELVGSLSNLSSEGLKIVVERDSSTTGSDIGGQLLAMNLVANDRAGIVREVTAILAARGVNVEEFSTECAEAPQGGGRIFKASARLRVPTDLTIEVLQNALEELATDLMIDFSVVDD